jgi:prolyl oligopeptidase PreP (S9A serine peptidase family)
MQSEVKQAIMRRGAIALVAAWLVLVGCGGSPVVEVRPAPAPPRARETTAPANTPAPRPEDPYLWLEDISGDKALGWVRAQNALSQKELEASPRFFELRDRLLSIYDSTDKIPFVVAHDKWLYNLISLRTDWTIGGKVWPAGALLVAPLADFRAGKRELTMLFEPKPNTSRMSYTATKSALIVVELEDVKSRVYLHEKTKAGWRRTKIETPEVGSFSVGGPSAECSW